MASAEVLVNHDEVIHVAVDGDDRLKPSTFDFGLDLLTPGGGYAAPGDTVIAADDVNLYTVAAIFENGVVEVDRTRTEEMRQSHLALAAGASALS